MATSKNHHSESSQTQISANSADNTKMQIVMSNLITLIIALTASFFTYQGGRETNDVDMYKTLVMQYEGQQKRMGEMQAQIIKSNLRIIELEAEIRREVSHEDVLRSYIDSLPAPAWIKRARSNGEFEMYLINKAYSYKYGISKGIYEGRTDRELGLFEEAEIRNWELNDRAIYQSGGSIRTTEMVIDNGVKTQVGVWKFAIELPGGDQGVGGLVVNE